MKTESLPAIPDKRYFSIGEVGDLCWVKPHVLRYWEQEFSKLSPVKRRGNRRYYQRHDIEIVRHIRALLYDQGFTIQGARRQLDRRGRSATLSTDGRIADSLSAIRQELQSIVRELDQ